MRHDAGVEAARKTGALARLTGVIARHPWRAIGIWVLIIAAVIGAAAAFGGALQNKFEIPNSDAQKATDQIGRAHV